MFVSITSNWKIWYTCPLNCPVRPRNHYLKRLYLLLVFFSFKSNSPILFIVSVAPQCRLLGLFHGISFLETPLPSLPFPSLSLPLAKVGDIPTPMLCNALVTRMKTMLQQWQAKHGPIKGTWNCENIVYVLSKLSRSTSTLWWVF